MGIILDERVISVRICGRLGLRRNEYWISVVIIRIGNDNPGIGSRN